MRAVTFLHKIAHVLASAQVHELPLDVIDLLCENPYTVVHAQEPVLHY